MLVFVVARSNDANDAGRPQTGAGWADVEQPPLSPRDSPALSWTGEELIVFGGRQPRLDHVVPLNDGAAYSPERGSWRQIAPPPFSPALYLPVDVWAGSEMIIAGVPCDDTADPETAEAPTCEPGGVALAAYEPSGDRWRALPAPPTEAQGRDAEYAPVAVGWSGTEAIFQIEGRFFALDPKVESWRGLPDVPLEPRATCLRGTTLTAVRFLDQLFLDEETEIEADRRGSTSDFEPPAPDPGPEQSAAVLDLAGSDWQTITKADTGEETPLSLIAVCAGGEVLTLPALVESEGAAGLAVFKIRDRSWESLERPPADIGAEPTSVFTGDEVLLWTESGVLGYDPATRTWRSAAESSALPEEALWVGDRVVQYQRDPETLELRLSTLTLA